jgi:hypothetical protein
MRPPTDDGPSELVSRTVMLSGPSRHSCCDPLKNHSAETPQPPPSALTNSTLAFMRLA